MGRTNVVVNSGGGIDIQGIVNEYEVASGGNINAGDFVEFINSGTMGRASILDSSINKIPSRISFNTSVMSAVLLSENNVFIAYGWYSTSTPYYMYGLVCTINEASISIGTATPIQNNYTGGIFNNIIVVTLSKNKVFVIHNYGESNIYSVVCDIDNTTITPGTTTYLSNGRHTSAIALSENKVFIPYGYNSSYYYLYGMICTISDTNITIATNTQLLTSSYEGRYTSTVLLSENKVFIAQGSTSQYSLCGMICTISDTTITVGTQTAIGSNQQTGREFKVVKLKENKIFVVHTYTNNAEYLWGVVCLINGTTINVGIDTQLSSVQRTGSIISVAPLSQNQVLIIHTYDTTYKLYYMKCKIDGTIIIPENDILLYNSTFMNGSISNVLFKNKILIFYCVGNNSYLYRNFYSIKTILNKVENSSQIVNGVAKTSGVAGDIIEVVEPDFN